MTFLSPWFRAGSEGPPSIALMALYFFAASGSEGPPSIADRRKFLVQSRLRGPSLDRTDDLPFSLVPSRLRGSSLDRTDDLPFGLVGREVAKHPPSGRIALEITCRVPGPRPVTNVI
jgi:hypothetical protein